MQTKSSDVREFLFTRVMIFLFKAGSDKPISCDLIFYQFSTVTLTNLCRKCCKTCSWCALRNKCRMIFSIRDIMIWSVANKIGSSVSVVEAYFLSYWRHTLTLMKFYLVIEMLTGTI